MIDGNLAMQNEMQFESEADYISSINGTPLLPLSPKNLAEHLARKERVHNFMISRGIKCAEERCRFLRVYASHLRSNKRQFKILKTICATNITLKIFKKWFDNKLKKS